MPTPPLHFKLTAAGSISRHGDTVLALVEPDPLDGDALRAAREAGDAVVLGTGEPIHQSGYVFVPVDPASVTFSENGGVQLVQHNGGPVTSPRPAHTALSRSGLAAGSDYNTLLKAAWGTGLTANNILTLFRQDPDATRRVVEQAAAEKEAEDRLTDGLDLDSPVTPAELDAIAKTHRLGQSDAYLVAGHRRRRAVARRRWHPQTSEHPWQDTNHVLSTPYGPQADADYERDKRRAMLLPDPLDLTRSRWQTMADQGRDPVYEHAHDKLADIVDQSERQSDSILRDGPGRLADATAAAAKQKAIDDWADTKVHGGRVRYVTGSNP